MKGRVFIVSAFSFQGRILSDTFFLQMTEKFFNLQKRHLCYVIGRMSMHQLTIDRLGPVQHCELAVRQYTVLTGFQAAGKSTVAKVIYFFRTMKDDIFQLIQQQEYSKRIYGSKYASSLEDAKQRTLCGDFESLVRSKFLSTFGSSYSMDKRMRLCYRYHDDVKITISLTESRNSLTPNFIWVEYSPQIRSFLNRSWTAKDPGSPATGAQRAV